MTEEFGAFNPLIPSLVNHISDKINFVVFGKDLKDDVKDVAEKSEYKGKYTFWYTTSEDRLGGVVLQNIGVSEDLFNIAIFDSEFTKKFFLKASKKEDVLGFLADHSSGKLKPFLKSGKRPKDDSDSKHPGIKIVVGESFEELVINSDKDVFLDVWAPWCGPCVASAPAVEKLGSILKDDKNVIVAKMNCDENDVDPKYFSVQSIPLFLFFKKGSKDKPLKYNGGRKTSDFLKYIQSNSSSKVEFGGFDELIKEEFLNDKQKEVAGEVNRVLTDYNKFEKQLDESNLKVKDLATKLTSESKSATDGKEVEKLLKEFQQKLGSFDKQIKELKDIEEKKALKNVKKVHSEDEYKKLHESSKGKLVVVDFTATWCGPCRFIGPHFAEFSEKYTDVVFVKVDVDEVPAVPQNADPPVECYPTFHFIKDGKFLEKFEGASPEEVEKLVKKLK